MADKPKNTYRAGALSVTVWENTNQVNGKDVQFQTVSIQRGYKDKEDKWQNTNSLRKSDLPKVVMLLQKAYEEMTLNSDE